MKHFYLVSKYSPYNPESNLNSNTDDLKQREEKGQRLQNELRHLLESLAIMLSTPCRFVESHECSVKERIRELLNDNKDKTSVSSVSSFNTTVLKYQFCCCCKIAKKLCNECIPFVIMLLQQVDHLRDKVASLNSQLHRLQESLDLESSRVRHTEDDKCSLETRLHDTEAKLSSCEAIRDNLRRDKSIVRTSRCKVIVLVGILARALQ